MEDEAVLLVLKFCERGELLDVVNTQRAAGQQANVTRYFAQILRGAAFLHANDIAHRDLSLENVLVDERDCCQITDFGLAAQCKGKVNVRPVGKLRYMARKLVQQWFVDPAERSTLAQLESHPALPAVEGSETRPASPTMIGEEQPEDSLAQLSVSNNDDTRQRARSLGRFNGKGSLASVSPNTPLSEAGKNKQALASSAIKATAVSSAPVTGNNGSKNQCAGGRLLRKCFATRA
ncbi:Protoporphyrinogen oxidase [Phytophthora nicotianae]|uniref:Protoporphyrinogen oxidase n=1 Tax=Phytophthora nicotianae TaxID=4792 RepID=A0A0W8DPQ5_PHYNI|nr:Protoporphyrinogen oxidase [Phytophthora nicotianae]